MKAWLEINGDIVKKSGSLNAFISHDNVIIANPSEVLAHDDELRVFIKTNNKKITDQAYTKILSNSDVKLEYVIEGSFLTFKTHPILFYNRAKAEIENVFFVKDKAIIIESYALGREAHGEKFKEGKIRAKTLIYYNSKLLVFDVYRVTGLSYLNTIGSSGLIGVYRVGDYEVDIEKISISSEDIYERWSRIVE
ncbi:MAG: urease accessory protein UreD [Metallosphaera sp.]|uniref:urease accessory protein UreD n=1 Tax=Metallosphaera sp. TaxID=2020860 RepID=UPI00316879EE